MDIESQITNYKLPVDFCFEMIPLHSYIESVMDEADLQEVYDTERHLLYVACTRARDRLMMTSVEPASEFVDDLLSQVTKS